MIEFIARENIRRYGTALRAADGFLWHVINLSGPGHLRSTAIGVLVRQSAVLLGIRRQGGIKIAFADRDIPRSSGSRNNQHCRSVDMRCVSVPLVCAIAGFDNIASRWIDFRRIPERKLVVKDHVAVRVTGRFSINADGQVWVGGHLVLQLGQAGTRRFSVTHGLLCAGRVMSVILG